MLTSLIVNLIWSSYINKMSVMSTQIKASIAEVTWSPLDDRGRQFSIQDVLVLYYCMPLLWAHHGNATSWFMLHSCQLSFRLVIVFKSADVLWPYNSSQWGLSVVGTPMFFTIYSFVFCIKKSYMFEINERNFHEVGSNDYVWFMHYVIKHLTQLVQFA